MRVLGTILWGLLGAVIIVLLATFAAQNLGPTRVQFVGSTFTADIWWLVVACAALGFVVGLLMLGPGRIAADWRIRQLTRDDWQVRSEYAALRERHAALQAERDTLHGERDHLRVQLAEMLTALPAPPAEPIAQMSAEAAAAIESRPQQSGTHRIAPDPYVESDAVTIRHVRPGPPIPTWPAAINTPQHAPAPDADEVTLPPV